MRGQYGSRAQARFSPKMEVVPRSTGRKWLSFVLVVVTISCVGFFSYREGHKAGVEVKRQTLVSLNKLREDLIKLNKKTAESGLEMEKLQVANLLERQFQTELRDNMLELERTIARQKNDLNFYKKILAPTKQQEGLRIERIDLSVEDEERAEMNLVLVQIRTNQKIIEGTIKVTFSGKKNGKDVIYPLTKVAKVDDYPMRFKFKYLQEFPAILRLPAGFKPATINVRVDANSRHGTRTATRVFDWSQLQG